jgi:hypothetical protein
MPSQTPVGYSVSFDKETRKLVLEIFDLKMAQEKTAYGRIAELHFEGETAPMHLKIMFPDYKTLMAYLLYNILYK